MNGKFHFSSALIGLAVFGGAFFAALTWFADNSAETGTGAVALNLLGASAGLKVPVFIVVVLLAAWLATITIFKSREKILVQNLRASEDQYSLSIAATQDGMWFKDFQTGDEIFTLRWMEILGFSQGDIRHDRAVSIIHPDDHERAAQTLRVHLDSKSPYDLEIRLRHKQGYYVWVRTKGQAVWDENGEPIRMAASITEITDRMRAEDALRQSQGQFKAISDNSPSPIYLTDTESRLLMVNRTYQKFYGVTEEQALTMPTSEWLGGINAEMLLEADQKILMSGKPLELQFETEMFDGTKRQMQSVKFPIFDADNNVIGIGGIDTDVTEQKLAEKNLKTAMHAAEAANRSKSEFVANMSHELRTPLNAIIGFSEIMANEFMGPVGSPKYLEYAKDINGSGSHLLEIINTMLDLSKVEAGKFELQEDTIDVPEAVNACLTLIKGQAEKRGVHLENNTPEGLPALIADQRNLKQILLNLLTNAIKYTPAGGKITIETWCRQDTGYVFTISDTGVGIAEEDIPMVLAPFGQVESALSRTEQGTGLGLPLTKSFVELHGGSFDIRSTVGAGTTVTVRFPSERIVPKRLSDKPLLDGAKDEEKTPSLAAN
jgi:PAS domain S-box-containing protein